MKKVCLVKAGNFLLGIDTSHILSILNVSDLKDKKINENSYSFIPLESFLTQSHHNISGSEIIVLKNKNNKKHLALLIDKTLGEIKLPGQFEPYPRLYPELAKECCPEIFINRDQIVLLLDPKQLNIVYRKLHTDNDSITLNNIIPVEEQVEQEDILRPDNSDTSVAKNETALPKSVTKINDETISSIASWTFTKYNEFYTNGKVIKFYSNEKMTISVDELPSGLIRQQGLSDKSLQNLIDKTILQCEKTRYKTIKDMIKNKLKDIKF